MDVYGHIMKTQRTAENSADFSIQGGISETMDLIAK